jgi:hypothetical protein
VYSQKDGSIFFLTLSAISTFETTPNHFSAKAILNSSRVSENQKGDFIV